MERRGRTHNTDDTALTVASLPGSCRHECARSLYAIFYVLISVTACFVWLFNQDTAADPVKAASTTFLGLLLPIVRGYFTPK